MQMPVPTFGRRLVSTAKTQWEMACRYPVGASLALVTFAISLHNGHRDGRTAQALGYLAAVCVCVFLTDLATASPTPGVGFPIKRPAVQEALVIVGCLLLGLTYLYLHFVVFGGMGSLVEKLAILPLIVFVFPIVLALIYLFLYRYRPSELGLNLRYWWLPALVLAIFGAMTYWGAPQQSHWRAYFREEGIAGWIMSVVLGAALSEEFTRMLLQTRLGAAFRNKGMGFIAATFLWACLHMPLHHWQAADASWPRTFMSVVGLMPEGFLWGYMTHRTKSLFPAVVVHSCNLWGLVNF